jgi:hypothetical protein
MHKAKHFFKPVQGMRIWTTAPFIPKYNASALE